MNASKPTIPSLPRTVTLAALLAVLFFVAGGNSNAPSEPSVVPAKSENSINISYAAEASPPDLDAEYRTLALGTWHDEYKGKRTMKLHDDGTGIMTVELSGLTAKLFADRLEFDMIWSIEDGRMKKQTLGGRPGTKVRAILSMMGDRVDEPILELSEQRLLLLDADGKTQYDWRRTTNR